jgi:hypothetical protein
MKPAAVDFDETTGGRVGRLDARGHERSDRNTGADDGGDGEKHETDHANPPVRGTNDRHSNTFYRLPHDRLGSSGRLKAPMHRI